MNSKDRPKMSRETDAELIHQTCHKIGVYRFAFSVIV